MFFVSKMTSPFSLSSSNNPRVDTIEECREEDRLMHKWFFSPKRLTEYEKSKLKFYVNRNERIRSWIREEINKL